MQSPEIESLRNRQAHADRLAVLDVDRSYGKSPDLADSSWSSDEETNVRTRHGTVRLPRIRRRLLPTARSSAKQRQTSVFKPVGNATPTKLALRSARGKSDKGWIALLERQNEELISQLHTLTSDMSCGERSLKQNLKRLENENRLFKQQIAESDLACKVSEDSAKSQVNEIRSKATLETVTLNRRVFVAQSQAAELRSSVESLVHERELLYKRLEKQGEEVMRLKRRNAELAERLTWSGTIDRPSLSRSSTQYRESLDGTDTELSRWVASRAAHTNMQSQLAGQFEDNLYGNLTSSVASGSTRQSMDFRDMMTETSKYLQMSGALLSPPLTEKALSPLGDTSLARDCASSSSILADNRPGLPLSFSSSPTSLRTTSSASDQSPGTDTHTQARPDTLHRVKSDSAKRKRTHFFRIPFSPRFAMMPQSFRAAVLSLQWFRFVFLLLYAVGLTLREGPQRREKSRSGRRDHSP